MTPYCVMTPYSVTTPCTVIDQRQLHWSLFTGVIIGSVNGLAPNQQQVITWTNDDFYEQTSMKFWKFIFTEDNELEMLSSKWWPFCFSHNVPWGIYQIINTKTNTFFFHIQTFIYHRSAHISLHANRKIRVTKKQLDVLQTKMFQNTDKFHMYGLSMTKKVSYKNLDLNFLFVQLAHLIQILPEVMIKKIINTVAFSILLEMLKLSTREKLVWRKWAKMDPAICGKTWNYYTNIHKYLGAVSTYRYRLTSIGIPIIKIRRSHDRLIFIMGILYKERRSLYWNRVLANTKSLVPQQQGEHKESLQ